MTTVNSALFPALLVLLSVGACREAHDPGLGAARPWRWRSPTLAS